MAMLGRLAGILAVIASGIAFSLSPASAVSPVVAVTSCTPQGALGACFGMPPAPPTAQSLNINVPRAGKVVVSVNGSGYCQNFRTNMDEVADFETQIVLGNLTPSHKGPGGLRINNRIPRALTASVPFTVPFNLSSHRVFAFPASATGNKNFNLRVKSIRLDPHVACYAFSLNMTAVFYAD